MARSLLDVWSRWMWCIGSIVGLAVMLDETADARIGFALFGSSVIVLMFDIVVLKEES